jgi:hypothetical protein
LLLGDTERSEFSEARACLERWGEVAVFESIDRAASALADGTVVPEVIAVAQSFPGQFSQQAIDRLRRGAPLARIVGLMGSWCEGEMRTGTPWPAVVRTYWHQWSARCDRELSQFAEGGCGSWTLPATATEEERLLVNAAQRWPPRAGLVVISTFSPVMAEWLSSVCRARGWATLWQRAPATVTVKGATAALFDGSDLGRAEEEDLRRLAAALDPAPVIALLGFPRVDDCRRAQSAGAAVVLSKPLAINDLFWALDATDCLPVSQTPSVRRSSAAHSSPLPLPNG